MAKRIFLLSQVATESYKCSGPVAKDFDWTGRSQLETQMVENARQDSAITRQYIGTYSGLTRTFPGCPLSDWDMPPTFFVLL
jgi:hypothetical protein